MDNTEKTYSVEYRTGKGTVYYVAGYGWRWEWESPELGYVAQVDYPYKSARTARRAMVKDMREVIPPPGYVPRHLRAK